MDTCVGARALTACLFGRPELRRCAQGPRVPAEKGYGPHQPPPAARKFATGFPGERGSPSPGRAPAAPWALARSWAWPRPHGTLGTAAAELCGRRLCARGRAGRGPGSTSSMLSDCNRWYPEPLGASRSHHQSSAERVRAAAGCTTRTLRRARRARPAAPEAITARRAPDSARERKGRVLRRKGVTRRGLDLGPALAPGSAPNFRGGASGAGAGRESAFA